MLSSASRVYSTVCGHPQSFLGSVLCQKASCYGQRVHLLGHNYVGFDCCQCEKFMIKLITQPKRANITKLFLNNLQVENCTTNYSLSIQWYTYFHRNQTFFKKYLSKIKKGHMCLQLHMALSLNNTLLSVKRLPNAQNFSKYWQLHVKVFFSSAEWQFLFPLMVQFDFNTIILKFERVLRSVYHNEKWKLKAVLLRAALMKPMCITNTLSVCLFNAYYFCLSI